MQIPFFEITNRKNNAITNTIPASECTMYDKDVIHTFYGGEYGDETVEDYYPFEEWDIKIVYEPIDQVKHSLKRCKQIKKVSERMRKMIKLPHSENDVEIARQTFEHSKSVILNNYVNQLKSLTRQTERQIKADADRATHKFIDDVVRGIYTEPEFSGVKIADLLAHKKMTDENREIEFKERCKLNEMFKNKFGSLGGFGDW